MLKRNRDIPTDETNRKLTKVSQKSVRIRNSISQSFSKTCKNNAHNLYSTKRLSSPGISFINCLRYLTVFFKCFKNFYIV